MVLIDNGLEIVSEAECHALLRRHSFGRVAVTVAALPAVFPVHYVIVEDDIVFLTGDGTKLRAGLARAVVAFQIDDFDVASGSGWSVMVVGVASEITDPEELAAVRMLPLRPIADGEQTHYVKIRPELVSGRRIVT